MGEGEGGYTGKLKVELVFKYLSTKKIEKKCHFSSPRTKLAQNSEIMSPHRNCLIESFKVNGAQNRINDVI